MESAEYKCDYSKDGYIRVRSSHGKSCIVIETYSNGLEVGARIFIRTEDLPRLIAQLTAGKGEPSAIDELTEKALGAAIDDVVEILKVAGFDGPNGVVDGVAEMATRITQQQEVIAEISIREHELQVKIDELSGESEQLPTKDTIDVRIAVVVSQDKKTGEIKYAAVGCELQDSALLMDIIVDHEREDVPGLVILGKSLVSAIIPIVNPVVHEVEGKIEVKKQC